MLNDLSKYAIRSNYNKTKFTMCVNSQVFHLLLIKVKRIHLQKEEDLNICCLKQSDPLEH